MRPSVQVRAATSDDGVAIGRVHVESWRATYRGIFPDDYLDGLDADVRGRGWTANLTLNAGNPEDPSATLTLVAEVDGRVVGFATLGPYRDDAVAQLGELWSIYVGPTVTGNGYGRILLEHAEAQFRRRGMQTAVLWVAERNSRARGFYEHVGWSPDGTEKIDENFVTPIVDVRYRKRLSV